ncbi:MAG: sugar phosphate isomerase/epimerase [Anaerolineae bacterium]|jgi:sugar phosphate isomerase/epimerase
MKIEYAISLWNYDHYAEAASLEDVLGRIRSLGYGVELWGWWRGERYLYGVAQRAEVQAALGSMPVSLHSSIVRSLPEHRAQIDAAHDLGAGVLVVHSDEFFAGDQGQLDVGLCREVVAYAAQRGVRIALENGQLPFLEQALAAVDGLKICLDVGHVYFTSEPMAAYLSALKTHIVHLHLQDILTPAEIDLPNRGRDHYTPGTGGIPAEDWQLLVATLREIDFEGSAVFEIRPRNPYQTAYQGSRFFDSLLGVGPMAVRGY